jgi:FKBP-type peptidyl-prolyl cis-trans isomerase 2
MRTVAFLAKGAVLLLLIIAAGCAASPERRMVGVGEPVRIDYDCRLQNGELAATTDGSLAGDAAVPKSEIFLPAKKFGSLEMISGRSPVEAGAITSMEEDIASRLALAVPGIPFGKPAVLELKSELIPGRVGDERFLKMAKVWNRPKEKRMPRTYFSTDPGRQPVVGGKIAIDPVFPGQITGVSDKEVIISFSIPEKGTFRTPYGLARVRDAGDHFDIDIDARQGSLIRTGPLVGRISEVTERLITIDYGYLFGGETLSCSVRTEAAELAGDTSKGPAGKQEKNAEARSAE